MNQNYIYRDNWTIVYEQADLRAYHFWIEAQLLNPYEGTIELIHLNVGVFKEIDFGLKRCQNLIDMCLVEQKRVAIKLIEVYRQNRHVLDKSKIFDEIEPDGEKGEIL
jgi:hypothetical protein